MKRISLLGAGAILATLASNGAAQTAPAEPASQASVQELTRRVEALERILAPVIGQAEQNSRSQQILSTQVERLAQETVSELAALRAELARQAAAARQLQVNPAQAGGGTAEATASPGAQIATSGNADYLARARAAIAAQAWGQAEYDASAQLALSAQGEQAIEATHLLGRSLLGQGHVASAAEKFLLVYDSKPQPNLAAENMFYLGEALRLLGLSDTTQLCAVYAETLQQHGVSLGADRVAKVRAHLTEQNCT